MFERYTEKARRVIFFARYEASKYGSPYIETEDLLLGLLREDAALARRAFGSEDARSRSFGATESIRRKIAERGPLGKKSPTSVDLPLSNESKRVLAYAGEEAERLANRHIGTEHLLLGLLREKGKLCRTTAERRRRRPRKTTRKYLRMAEETWCSGGTTRTSGCHHSRSRMEAQLHSGAGKCTQQICLATARVEAS